MVLRRLCPPPLIFALGALALVACVTPNERGTRPVVPGDAATDGRDAGGSGPEVGPDGPRDVPSPADAGDTSTPPPADARDTSTPPPPDARDTSAPPVDGPAPECTPREVGCTANNDAPRVCNDQSKWVTMAACPAQTTCNGGACVCPGNCADPTPVAQTQIGGGVADDLAGGGRSVFLGINGPRAGIRRFDTQNGMEMSVTSAMGSEVGTFALDSDSMGNLIWCSDLTTPGSPTRTGRLVYGTLTLDTGPCTHVRRHNNFVYFKSDVVYRKTLDAGSNRSEVSREAMTIFEIAGDSLYFVGEANQAAFLKRFPLADASKVETITTRPNSSFRHLLPDATHVYLISEGVILRARQTPNAQAEVFWEEMGPEAWAMAQTDTHLYWSATTSSGASDCSEAQVLRRAKSGGGMAVALARAPGYCAGELVRIENNIYTSVWLPPPSTTPARILRIRL